MHKLFFVFILVGQLFALAANEANALSRRLPQCREIAEKASGGSMLVDVRTREEVREGSLPGALHIPLEQINSSLNQFPADKHAEIILYCRSGRRSGIAKRMLEKQGYKNIINAGGYAELVNCWKR